MVVAMWYEIKGWNSFSVIVLYIMYCKYMFILLAYPIRLCLAMIVYGVYVSRWCCKWI